MAELNYDFNMNQFKNRLETFKDWPFTEETGSSCTARKVYAVFLTSRQRSSLQNVFCSRCRLKLFSQQNCSFCLVRWQKQDFFILPTIVILILRAVLFVSRNLKDGNLRTILCTQELYEIYSYIATISLYSKTEAYHPAQGDKLAGVREKCETSYMVGTLTGTATRHGAGRQV